MTGNFGRPARHAFSWERTEKTVQTDRQTNRQSQIEPKRKRERGHLLLSSLFARRSSRLPLFQWAQSPGPFKPEPVPASSHFHFCLASYDTLHVTVNGRRCRTRIAVWHGFKGHKHCTCNTQVVQLSLSRNSHTPSGYTMGLLSHAKKAQIINCSWRFVLLHMEVLGLRASIWGRSNTDDISLRVPIL